MKEIYKFKFFGLLPATTPQGCAVIIMLLSVALTPSGWLLPQSIAADAVPTAGVKAQVPQEKLDSLLAPIALYPDQLLTQTLMAATYPLDVVEAARFVKANKDLKGDALDKAVLEKKWDPSVQSLTAFPQVLEMMNDKLEWTQELGDAFLADEKRVMQTVQSLRQKAMAAGNLPSNEQQKVVTEQSDIIIEPATQTVYVPTYNPTIVYGVWWAPMYPPYYWPPPPYYYPGYHAGGAVLIGFGIGMVIGANHWGWCHPAWHSGSVNITINKNNVFINNNPGYKTKVNNGNWQHNPAQRKGVAYRDAATRDQYRKTDANAVSSRRDVRGIDSGGASTGQRPSSSNSISTNRPSTPGSVNTGGGYRSSDARPAFDANQSRSQTESYSNRGASSRASMSRGGGGRGRR